MVVSETEKPAFTGTKSEQELAKDLYLVLEAHGRFMALNAPIRVSVESAIEVLKESHKRVGQDAIEHLAQLNPEIFQLSDIDGTLTISTTRTGKAPGERHVDQQHTFAARLMEPRPKTATDEIFLRPRPRMDSAWSIYDRVLNDIESPSLARSLSTSSPFDLAVTEPVELIAPAIESVEVVVEPVPVAQTITVPAAPAGASDVRGVADSELANALVDRFGSEPQVAHFGGSWMLEDRVPRFSKGELRKLKDYIAEQERPLTDDVLVQDVLDVRPRSNDFELVRFALNFRLSKEHRDFDFVGTSDQRFWSTSGLAPIGTTRRKPNEIGTDYRHLVDELPESPGYRSISEVTHLLTFYEFGLGLLPYDAEIQSLLPAPVLPNQRSAVLTFECPQSYTTYLVELRYPTPNRGGFIVGLDDFYSENLVPGAIISVRATANDGQFVMEYIATASQSQRLLELEDRRQRYVFRPTSFSCGVSDDQLLTEEKWSALNGEKPLDEKARRRIESVVAATFERLGHRLDGGGYSASFSELFAGVNIERPFSEAQLRASLLNDDSGAFAKDPDGPDDYTYIPGTNV